MIILSIRNEEETKFVGNNKYLNINFINQTNQLTKLYDNGDLIEKKFNKLMIKL